jgi:hypothetical protein
MIRKPIHLSVPVMAALLSVMGTTADVHANESRPNIPESEMMSFCRGEAASALQLSPRDISTLPVERSDGNNYRVYGQSPSTGDNALFFYCEFNQYREFDKVIKTSDKRSESATQAGEVVNLEDMPAFCRGMAAEKFQESPRRITTNKPAIQSDGSYRVFGQYDLSDSQIQVFTCKFSPQKKFMNVHKKQ